MQGELAAMSKSEVGTDVDSHRRDEVIALQDELVAMPKSQAGDGTRAEAEVLFGTSSACTEKAPEDALEEDAPRCRIEHGLQRGPCKTHSAKTTHAFVPGHGVGMFPSVVSRSSRHGNEAKSLHQVRHGNVTKLRHQPHEQSGIDVGVGVLSCSRGPCLELSSIDPSMHQSKEGDSSRRRVLPSLSSSFLPCSSVFHRRRLGPAVLCLCELGQAPWAALQVAV